MTAEATNSISGEPLSKVSNADCFRIGNIGRLFESDMQALLVTVRQTLEQMGLPLTASASS